MGASVSSVWYNIRVPHPTKEVPILDYDLALLFQPMLMLGITIGVALSVVFPYWLITVLIIILFMGLFKISNILLLLCSHLQKISADDFFLFYDQGPRQGPFSRDSRCGRKRVFWRSASMICRVYTVVTFLAKVAPFVVMIVGKKKYCRKKWSIDKKQWLTLVANVRQHIQNRSQSIYFFFMNYLWMALSQT